MEKIKEGNWEFLIAWLVSFYLVRTIEVLGFGLFGLDIIIDFFSDECESARAVL